MKRVTKKITFDTIIENIYSWYSFLTHSVYVQESTLHDRDTSNYADVKSYMFMGPVCLLPLSI